MNKLGQRNIEMFNRRPTQTCADGIFSLADLARENLHALRANRFLQKNQDSKVTVFNHGGLNKDILDINREAIDVFFAGQLVPSKRSEVSGVGRQKGLRPSAIVCGEKKS